VERIDDLAADRAATTLRFVSDSRVSGRAGCNQYAGPLQLGANTIRVTETLSTRMACAPAVMEQEGRFLAALGEVRTFRRDGDRLLLLDGAGRVRIRLAPLP
jgi:heat shock protein HslJ